MADIVASSPVARTINLTRSTISGSIFGIRSGVAALSPISPIQPRERLINTQEVSLKLITNQLSSLSDQMNDIGGALEKIAYYIAQDSSLEQAQTRQEQAQEKQLAEQGLRTRQESIIENKIKASLVAPVQAIAQKTQSVLSRLMQFFGTLLGGWLVVRGINTLKALSEGNTKKLEDIRDQVIKNLGIAAGALFLINGGFFAIIGTIGSITLKLTSALGKFLFLKPFQFLSRLIGDAIKNIVKPASTAAGAAAAKSGTGFLSSIRSGLGSIGRGISRVAGPTLTVVSGAMDFFQRMGEGQSLFQATAGTGGSLLGAGAGAKVGAIGGSFFGPIGTAAGAALGGAGGFILGGMGVDLLTGANNPQNKETSTPKAQVKPQKSKTPVRESTSSNTQASAENVQSPMITLVDDSLPSSASQTVSTAIPSIQAIPSSSRNVANQMIGPLPEPKPTVLMARTSSGQQVAAGSQSPPVMGPANNVPPISSSNPENFYTLYSQIHYNVVV